MPSRRQYMGTVGGLLAVTSGCLHRVRSTEISGEEPTLQQGEESTLSVTAETVGGMTLRTIPERTQIEFALDEATIDPSPNSGVDTYPPVWYWSRTRLEVTVEIPIAVSADAQPGTYTYEIAIFERDSRDADSVTETFEITVDAS